MNKDNENFTGPTFEQLPAMLAELSRKFDAFVKRPEETEAATPMGVTICAEFLTAIEGRKVTNGAVYNRGAQRDAAIPQDRGSPLLCS